MFQPIAADDVAAITADVAIAPPRNGTVEIAGPERVPFNEMVARLPRGFQTHEGEMALGSMVGGLVEH